MSALPRRSRWRLYLRLGRVSNLPTVWTNCLAGTTLAGGDPSGPGMLCALMALSLFYTGGMFLNDAFDWRFDARFRSDRPIPSHAIGLREVYVAGVAQLVLAELIVVAGTRLSGTASTMESAGWGIVLAALIVYYDVMHKTNRSGPLVMGLCRMAAYLVAAAVATTALRAEVMVAAATVGAYVSGLTLIAGGESGPGAVLPPQRSAPWARWPVILVCVPLAYVSPLLARMAAATLLFVLLAGWVFVALRLWLKEGQTLTPVAVIRLIAGISLVDASLIALHGRFDVALIAVAGFVLTIVFQRAIPGT